MNITYYIREEQLTPDTLTISMGQVELGTDENAQFTLIPFETNTLDLKTLAVSSKELPTLHSHYKNIKGRLMVCFAKVEGELFKDEAITPLHLFEIDSLDRKIHILLHERKNNRLKTLVRGTYDETHFYTEAKGE